MTSVLCRAGFTARPDVSACTVKPWACDGPALPPKERARYSTGNITNHRYVLPGPRGQGRGRRRVVPALRAILASLILLAVSALWGREVTDQTGRRINIPDHPQRIV